MRSTLRRSAIAALLSISAAAALSLPLPAASEDVKKGGALAVGYSETPR